MLKKSIALAALLGLAGAGTSPARAEEQNNLETMVQDLIEQNRQLTERLGTVEKELAAPQEPGASAGDRHLLAALGDRVVFSGLLEVEAAAAEDFTKADTSDVTLATVELGLDARLTEWTGGHILFKFEEDADGDRLLVDEGTITLGNPEKFPWSLAAGKMYVPFGSYASNMISDPLPLEIGEINESAIRLGGVVNGLYGSIYAFNGDVDETSGDDAIRSWGANLGFGMERHALRFDLGLDWLNNMADTDALQDYLATTSTTVAGFPAGLAVHGLLQYGPMSLLAEYVAALDAFQAGEVDFNSQGAEPAALMTELAFATKLSGREVTLALGYQQTAEALALGLAESRALAALRVGILANTTLAFEYAVDEDYDLEEGGTGEDGYTATMQLTYEF